MKKSNVVLLLIAFLAILGLILNSCSMAGQKPSVETPTDTDIQVAPVPLTPSEALEYDFSVPPGAASARALTSGMAKTLILMYHNITTLVAPGEYDRTVTDFENDLIFLKANGISVIGLDDILKIQNGSMTVPANARYAAIVFDDGYASMYTRAFPLLKKYNMKATFFLVTSIIGNPGSLTWDQVKTMSNYGVTKKKGKTPVDNMFDFGSHTVDHRSLEYDPAVFATHDDYLLFLNMELNQSRKAIQAVISQPNIFLALPYGDGLDADGHITDDILNSAIRTMYSGIRTSNFGTDFGAFNAYNTSWNYQLPSIPISGSYDIGNILHYYDWIWLY